MILQRLWNASLSEFQLLFGLCIPNNVISCPSKVKAVRAAIEKGTFSVDAEAIADKMLSNAQEILARMSVPQRVGQLE